MKIRLLIPVVIMIMILLPSCGSVEIDSQWRTGEIVVDGKIADWQGKLWEIKDSGLSVGVLNDENSVFLCLRAADLRAAAQVFRRGLVVWLDPKGGKDKVLGIHYPLGRDGSDFEGPPGNPDSAGQDVPARPRTRANLDEIEILGPGRDEKASLHIDELKGIRVAVSRSGGMIVYELAVPLVKGENAPYAAQSGPGKTLGIGFDAAEPDVLMPGRGMGGRMPGGIGGSRRGGFQGRGGMMGRGFRQNQPLKIWLKVNLAPGPV
jgi:hypothetical protein